MTPPVHVFFSTGEVSGDLAAARLVADIRRLAPDAVFTGIGGTHLRAAGVALDAWTTGLGTVGVVELVSAVPRAWRTFRRLRGTIRANRPDVAVLVGNDVFNVFLARWLARQRVPTVSYLPPQPWIWRIVARPIARSYDAILACFPVDRDVYGAADGGVVTYVGHYLTRELHRVTDDERTAARVRLNLDPNRRVVGLLPGSRRHEVRRLAPILLDAARDLRRHDGDVQFVIAAVEDHADWIGRHVARHDLAADLRLSGHSHDVLRASDAVVVASGTASLEAALLGVPMAIVYRVAGLTHAVITVAIRIGVLESYTFGLPNLVLGRRAVPELGQQQVTAERIAREIRLLLDDRVRRADLQSALADVGRLLEHAAGSDAAAIAVLELTGGAAARVDVRSVRTFASAGAVTTQPRQARSDSS